MNTGSNSNYIEQNTVPIHGKLWCYTTVRAPISDITIVKVRRQIENGKRNLTCVGNLVS